jgi:hypothetical protein
MLEARNCAGCYGRIADVSGGGDVTPGNERFRERFTES